MFLVSFDKYVIKRKTRRFTISILTILNEKKKEKKMLFLPSGII